jgi:hypothetical protein
LTRGQYNVTAKTPPRRGPRRSAKVAKVSIVYDHNNPVSVQTWDGENFVGADPCVCPYNLTLNPYYPANMGHKRFRDAYQRFCLHFVK